MSSYEWSGRQSRHTTSNGLDYRSNDTSFDSLRRQRRKRKRNKVVKYGANWSDTKKSAEVFDARGCHATTGLDLCDCLDTRCVGCFFKCPNKKCRSYKCGTDCRQKRKYYYESIEDQIQENKRLNDIVMNCDDSVNVVHIN